MIRERVYQYGIALLLTRGISFLFTLLVIRSLPLADTGTYYYLAGIAAVLEIFITWGMPVSIQTRAGQMKNSNLALAAVLLVILLSLAFLALFSIAELMEGDTFFVYPAFKGFVYFSAVGTAMTHISLAYHRSSLKAGKDIFLMVGRELIKLFALAAVFYFFTISLDSILYFLTAINIVFILFILFDLYKNSDPGFFSFKVSGTFLMQNGSLLMFTFLMYAFPLLFVKIFGYTGLGKESSALVNICLLTNSFFLLYANAWGMAVKPLISSSTNLEAGTTEKLWKATGNLYLGGCFLLFLLCLFFMKELLLVFKLDADSISVQKLSLIIMFYNLVFSIGSLNNSFLQMLKLTKQELKGLSFGFIVYPLIILYCISHSTIFVLAWALVAFEFFKILVQEYVLAVHTGFSTYGKLLKKLGVVVAGGCILLGYSSYAGWI